MRGWPERKCIRVMQAFMIHLALGDTLFCKTIKADTMAAYGRVAASFVKGNTGKDPRKYDNKTGIKMAKEYSDVLNEQAHWQTMPNRRVPSEVKQ